ncbi:MAG: hypothetical protein QOE52_977 [Mycobacterium sp.]|jgi:hypothetical protein|nr:hypothetical protein [Mycobacterium sp.]MDT5277125.1 hypothetical protein [Mycobacterium sp.]MDT5308733.1 hypothetical protein [Mycobacterium sp.]MDT5341793.1 hypothetical protein [Mycobacterium sp.]
MALCINSVETSSQMCVSAPRRQPGTAYRSPRLWSFGRTGEVGVPCDPADKTSAPAVNALRLLEQSVTGTESRRSPMPDLIQQGQQQQHRDPIA